MGVVQWAILTATALYAACIWAERRWVIQCECVGGPHGGYTCPRCR